MSPLVYIIAAIIIVACARGTPNQYGARNQWAREKRNEVFLVD